MQWLMFADLDDTLFTSTHKAPPTDAHVPLAYLRDGAPISYASPKQQAWLAHWLAHAIVIPVTARNGDAYRRVAIPFAHHAVINYGGIILNPDGTPEPQWLAQSTAQAAQSAARLRALAAGIPSGREDLNIRIIEDYGIPFYLLIKSTQGRALDDIAEHLRGQMRHPGDQLHHNGNNLAILPDWLDKSHAVRWLCDYYRARYGDVLTLGMGDSLIDRAFMCECDYLLCPGGSQIVKQW